MISTNKWDTQIAEKEFIVSLQTGTYTVLTGAFANCGNGFSITIPKTGLYRISCKYQADLSYTGNPSHALFTRLAVDGVEIDGTPTTTYRNLTNMVLDHSVFIEAPIQVFTAGQVITLQAYKSSADGALVYYLAGTYEGYLQAEMVTAYAPVIDNDKLYSTVAIDTGKIWIDSKKIYRRVFTGTTGAGVSSTLALGFTVDSSIDMKLIVDSSSFGWMYAGIGSANLQVYFTNTTQNDITLYHNAAHLQSVPYRLILEYTV